MEWLADRTRWVSDTAARSYRTWASTEGWMPGSLWVHPCCREWNAQSAWLPILFRGRRVVCKLVVPRTAQDQMVFLMPAASWINFCLLVHGSLARRAADCSVVTRFTVLRFITPLCFSHLPSHKDTEILLSLEINLAASERGFLWKCFSSH